MAVSLQPRIYGERDWETKRVSAPQAGIVPGPVGEPGNVFHGCPTIWCSMTEEPRQTAEPVGEVTHYFQNVSVAVVSVEAAFEAGDELHIEGANDDFRFTVESMEIDRQPVERVEAGDEVGVEVPQRAHEGSTVRRVVTEGEHEPMEAS